MCDRLQHLPTYSHTSIHLNCLQSGVVMGGTAILSAVNGLTPHMAGAIDIMVVQQPDGSLKCSPFYGANHTSILIKETVAV